MIEVTKKDIVNSIYCPKNLTETEVNFVFDIHSEITNESFAYEVVDKSSGSSFYKFDILFDEVPDGEYNWYVLLSGETRSEGLIRIGNWNPASKGTAYHLIQYDAAGYSPIDLQSKQVEINSEGLTTVEPDNGFVGLKEVQVYVDVPNEYEEGFEDGEAAQKAKLIALEVTANGRYEREDGYNQVDVDIDTTPYYESGYTAGYDAGYESGSTEGSEEGYESGYTAGVEAGEAQQKAKLITTAITENGTYAREDGYSSVSVDVPTTVNNQNKTVEYTENGTYIVVPAAGYSGLGSVTIQTNVPHTGHTDAEMEQAYQSGYTSGETVGYESGYTSGETVGYASGKTDGVAEQKAKLVETAITINGVYEKEDGYKKVTVNVPQTGSTINNQNKTIPITTNGTTAVTFDAGYTGLGTVTINTNVPTGHTDAELEAAYASGVTDGEVTQKAKLITTAVTTNGTYSRADGYSSITVNIPTGSTINNQDKSLSFTANTTTTITADAGYTGLGNVALDINIPQTGHTDAEMEAAYASGVTEGEAIGYASGYTSGETVGYNSGYTEGETAGYASGYTSGETAGYESGYTSGYSSGYTSGETVGYNSGYTEGEADQKAKLITTAVTENGTYSREDGFSSITVNTPVIHNQDKSVTYSANGAYTVTFDSGYSGLGTVTVNVAEPTSTLVFSLSPSTLVGTTAGVTLEIGQDTYNVDFTTGDTITFTGLTPGMRYTASYHFVSSEYITPDSVTGITLNGETIIHSVEYTTDQHLTVPFTIVANDTTVYVKWSKSFSGYTFPEFTYTIGSGETQTVVQDEEIMLLPGEEVSFKGDINRPAVIRLSSRGGTFRIKGNIMSLCYSTNYATADSFRGTTITERSARLSSIFRNCTGLTDASNLLLPVTDLSNESQTYSYMFSGCTALVTPPALPAIILGDYGAYHYMFQGCTSLTTAPSLPATLVPRDSYAYMFSGCTSLTTAPSLSSTSLGENAYAGMFHNCTSLTTAPSLPATTLEKGAYNFMFAGCTSLVNVQSVLPTMTLPDGSDSGERTSGVYEGMFFGCTSLTTAPELPATTLNVGCYRRMFSGCTSLEYIKCLATDISATKSTTDWVHGVNRNGTFVKNPNMSSWGTGQSGIPSGWTVQDAS